MEITSDRRFLVAEQHCDEQNSYQWLGFVDSGDIPLTSSETMELARSQATDSPQKKFFLLEIYGVVEAEIVLSYEEID